MKSLVQSALAIAALLGPVSTFDITDCNKPVPRTDDKFPGLVCKKRGHLAKGDQKLLRIIYSPTYDQCYSTCNRNRECNSMSWNPKTKECRLHYVNARSRGFQRDDRSDLIFSNWKCAEPLTGCSGLLNPSFDNPLVEGGGIRIGPTGYKGGRDQVYLTPWSDDQDLDRSGKSTPPPGPSFGYSRIGTAKDLPAGHDPIPAGNGESFAILTSRNAAGEVLGQDLPSLALNTTYSFEMTYSLLSIKQAPSTNYNVVALTSWRSDPSTPGDPVITGAYLGSTPADVDGTWKTLTGQFDTLSKLPANWYDGSRGVFSVELFAFDDNGNYVPDPNNGGSASLAIDNIVLKKAKASTTQVKPLNAAIRRFHLPKYAPLSRQH